MGPCRAAATATATKKQADLKPPRYKRLWVIFSAVAYVLFLGKRCPHLVFSSFNPWTVQAKACQSSHKPSASVHTAANHHTTLCVPCCPGVPVWWYTTSLHRPPLPHEAMQQVALEASSSTAYLPVSLQLVVALPEGTDPRNRFRHALLRRAPVKR